MKVFRKCKGRGGFSLAELLVAMLILSMMSSVACMGIATALQDRAKSITVANAQTVASTAASAVADQVRYGRLVKVDGDPLELESSTDGRVRLELDGGRLVASTAGGASYQLLGEKAYGGLALNELKFTLTMDGETVSAVQVELSVAEEAGSTEALWSLDYEVAPLNPYLASA